MTIVLLESLLESSEDTRNIWIAEPEKILQTHELSRVPAVLSELDEAVSAGYIAAGFISYEAGYQFLPNMPDPPVTTLPLVWFALSRSYETQAPAGFDREERANVEKLTLDTTLEEYGNSIRSIRIQIEEGYTYQVNFTMRYRGEFQGSPRALYHQLKLKQGVPYAAYIETPDWTILSLSPELFFRKRGTRISMRPMKGTSPRGRTLDEDALLSQQLSSSEKERAENLMIVDLLRNDLGKICEAGTIRVTRPLIVERYDTVLQMTSEIEGIAREDSSLPDLLRAVFPSGSVTGAPKVRTMQIIHDLEKSPRNIYTGCIGFVSKEETVFSVAIRTAVVRNGILEMGVGSGILYEADAIREYEECLLKARFLTDPPVEFELIETILWLPAKGYQRLSLHLDRLLNTAEYFLIPAHREQIVSFLEQNAPDASDARRVRLLMDRKGKMKIFAIDLEDIPFPKIRWAIQTTNSNNRFLYHKTTHRPVYQQELTQARQEVFFEVIFRNERGEVTEGAFSNLWILKNGVYYTPPISCGLLDGTYRRFLLSDPNFPAQEKVLFLKDVEEADEIFISNAIRGLLRVML